MAQAEAQAWWTEVEHLRERIEYLREHGDEPPDAHAPRGGAGLVVDHPSWAQESRTRAGSGAERVRPEADRPPTRRHTRAEAAREPSPFVPRRTVHLGDRASLSVNLPPQRAAAATSRSDGTDRAVEAARSYAARRRPQASAAERLAAHPDRIALWAFALGVCLLLVAAISAHGL